MRHIVDRMVPSRKSDISPSLHRIVFNDDIAITLDHLASARIALGQRELAILSLREAIERLERTLPDAGEQAKGRIREVLGHLAGKLAKLETSQQPPSG